MRALIIFAVVSASALAHAKAEQPMTISSSERQVTISGPQICTKQVGSDGKTSIDCSAVCKQAVDPKDGKVLIQC